MMFTLVKLFFTSEAIISNLSAYSEVQGATPLTFLLHVQHSESSPQRHFCVCMLNFSMACNNASIFNWKYCIYPTIVTDGNSVRTLGLYTSAKLYNIKSRMK